jgi:aspartate kinase
LPYVTYEEMLEMASSGAGVMMARSIEIARSYGVKLRVRSTFVDGEGTWIGEEDKAMLEKAIISGVTHDISEAKVSIIGVPDRPGIAAKVFRALADAGVNIDMIVQNVSQDGAATISFTLPKTDVPIATPILEALAKDMGASRVEHDPDVAKISLIGAGMKSHPGVAADMFDALAEAGINIEIISTSAIRVSCVISAAHVERAVQVVHARFQSFAEERVNG